MNYNENSESESSTSNIISNKSYIKEKVFCFYRSQSVCSVIIKKRIFIENNISFPSNRSFEDFFVLHKLISKSKTPLIIKKTFYNYTHNFDSVSNNLKINDFNNIFESVEDFHAHNENIDEFLEVLSERINNILKYVITKLSINGSLSYKNSTLLINKIFYYIYTYNIDISCFYYNLYLLANKDLKVLNHLNAYNINDVILKYFSKIIHRNEHIMQGVVNFLLKNNIKDVSILGIGNALFETVELISQNSIKISSIHTDLEVHSYLNNIQLLDLYSSNQISADFVIIASYASSNKFTKLAQSKGGENLMVFNFYNILNAN